MESTADSAIDSPISTSDQVADATAADDPTQSSSDPFSSPPVLSQSQTLPVLAQTQIGDQTIQLEVAITPQQQAIGLMHRSELADHRGMLFPFAQPRSTRFWMKNVRINLDMIFLLNGKVQAIAADVPPCTTEPCPVYGPPGLVDQVIELRGGRAAELGIEVGDTILIEPVEEQASS